jgi:hypothetical protein
MDQKAVQILDAFANAVEHNALTAADWRRLYDFTLYIHRARLSVTPWNVGQHLMTHGFSFQKAKFVSTEFKRFSELLALYDHQKAS